MVDAMKILGSLLGNQGGASSAGADILGNILKGALSGSGSSMPGQGNTDLLGGLLSMAMKSFTQGAPAQSQPRQSRSSQGGGYFKPDFGLTEPEPKMERRQANDQATILIRAMINSAKSDGRVDEEEGEKILGQLGDVSQDEIDFVRNEIAQPLDVGRFVQQVPRGMEQNVYAISLISIDLDTNKEARYLHELAQGLGLSPQLCNQIHDKVGAPKIYT